MDLNLVETIAFLTADLSRQTVRRVACLVQTANHKAEKVQHLLRFSVLTIITGHDLSAFAGLKRS